MQGPGPGCSVQWCRYGYGEKGAEVIVFLDGCDRS